MRPFFLNRIVIWAIGREILQKVPCLPDALLCVATFVKCSIIHNQYRRERKLWDELIHEPAMEYIAVDIACKETNSEKCAPQKSANYIDAPRAID